MADLATVLLETIPATMGAIRRGARQQGSDLTMPQLRALGYVDRHDGASLSSLSQRLFMTAPAASQLVDGLVDRGLLRRDEDPADRRRIRLTLTNVGRKEILKARAGARVAIDRILTRLSEQEAIALADALGPLRRAVEAEAIA